MKYPRKRHRTKAQAKRAVEPSREATTVIKKPLPSYINPEGWYH